MKKLSNDELAKIIYDEVKYRGRKKEWINAFRFFWIMIIAMVAITFFLNYKGGVFINL